MNPPFDFGGLNLVGMNHQLQMFNLRFCDGVSRLKKNVEKIEYKYYLKEKGKMVLVSPPKEIGAIRHVKIVTLSCCLGALKSLYICKGL